MPVSPAGELLYVSGAMIFTSGSQILVTTSQGTTLDYPVLLGTSALCPWVTLDCNK